jgi:3-oxoacyl-[acyl-carrier-protein] synthase-3
MSFTVVAVPKLIEEILERAEMREEEIDLYLLHQATRKMLQQLQTRIGVDDDRLPIRLAECGNTVSSTLPILISDMRRERRLQPGKRSLLIGFGVGWSWAGCAWTETYSQ